MCSPSDFYHCSKRKGGNVLRLDKVVLPDYFRRREGISILGGKDSRVGTLTPSREVVRRTEPPSPSRDQVQ